MMLRLCLLLFILSACASQAPEQAPQPEAVTRHLDNGLQVIYQPSSNSASKQTEISLLMRVGSLSEQDSERGYAHFVEHMAFSATEMYPAESQVRDALRQLGLDLGDHANARTSFDHTLYRLRLESNEPETLNNAIGLLAQWAYAIRFDEAQVAAEQPVVLAELRSREIDEARARAQLRQAALAGSCYAQRLPIGTEQSLQQVKAKALQAFYQRWYYPANAVLLVSGAFDPDAIHAQIERDFGQWKSEGEAAIAGCEIDPYARPQQQLIIDAQLVTPTLKISWNFAEKHWPLSKLERQTNLARQLALDVLDDRLESHVYDTKGAVGGISTGTYNESPTQKQVYVHATIPGGDLGAGVALLGGGLKSLKNHPITEQELKDAALRLRQKIDSQTFNPKQLTDIAIEHVLENRPLWTKQETLSWLDEQIKLIKIEDLHTAINPLLENPPHLQAVQSELNSNTEESLRTGFDESTSLSLKEMPSGPEGWPIQPQVTPELLKEQQHSGKLSQWDFANGLTVVHRQSTAAPGRVEWRLVGATGMNALDQRESLLARFALPIIGSSGLRQFNGPELSAWLEREGFSLYPNYTFYSKGAFGDGPAARLDEQMRLLYIALTEGHVDPAALEYVIQQNIAQLEKIALSPAAIWLDWAQSTIFQMDNALRTLTPSELKNLDTKSLQSLYQNHYAGMRNYVLAIVGDVSADDALAAVTASLASLRPIQNTVSELRTFPLEQVSGDYQLKGRGKREALGVQRWIIPKKDYNVSERKFFLQWFNAQLFEEVREKQGLVYGIKASASPPLSVSSNWVIELNFEASPDATDSVFSAINKVLDDMSATPPSKAELSTWWQARRDGMQQQWDGDNKAQTNVVAWTEHYGETFAQVYDMEKRVEFASKERMTALANLVTDPAHIVTRVRWLP